MSEYDPTDPFPKMKEVVDIKKLGETAEFEKLEAYLLNEIHLYRKTTTLGSIVDFVHKLRKVGYSLEEFLKLYSEKCSNLDGNERCSKCTVAGDVKWNLVKKPHVHLYEKI